MEREKKEEKQQCTGNGTHNNKYKIPRQKLNHSNYNYNIVSKNEIYKLKSSFRFQLYCFYNEQELLMHIVLYIWTVNW